jgi:hypothetical protein
MGLRLAFMSNNLEHMVGVVASLLAIDSVQKMCACNVFLFVYLCCLCVVNLFCYVSRNFSGILHLSTIRPQVKGCLKCGMQIVTI